jgi:hypothetical protein
MFKDRNEGNGVGINGRYEVPSREMPTCVILDIIQQLRASKM